MSAPTRCLTILMLIMSLLLAAVPAGAAAADPLAPGDPGVDTAAGGTGGAPIRATIDATTLPDGSVTVSILVSQSPGGVTEWRPLSDSPGLLSGVEDILLSDGQGLQLPVERGGDALTACLPPGDWVLSYRLRGLSVGAIIAPTELLLLPGGGPVELVVTPPSGWQLLGNMPAEPGLVDQIRLPLMRFLLTPPSGPLVSALTGSPVRIELISAVDQPLDVARISLCERLAAAFCTTFGAADDPARAPIRLLVDGTITAGDLAADLLDALWSGCVPQSADAEAQGFCERGCWPLVRAELLAGEGLVDRAAINARICADWRTIQQTPGGQTVVPLRTAPLAVACLLSLARCDGVMALLRLAQTQEPVEPGVTAPFPERLIAASPEAVAALIRQLTSPWTADLSDPLPDLPDDVLATGDPDSDGDGLPDRLDQAPLERGITITVAGRTVRLDVAPVIIDGRVMVPLRFLAQRLGLRVGWDQASRRATIAKSGLTASFLLDCHYFVLNGRLRYLDVPARSVGGRTLVPLRYAAKALGVAIDWLADTRTVSVDVTRPYVEPEAPAATGNVAYLTFDDGPDPTMTPRVLAALAENDVKATFFVIGSCVRGNPALTERIVAAGHALGNHSFSHITSRSNPRWIYASPETYLAELAACDRAIADATGLTVRVSRPPGGSAPWVTAEFRAAIADAGYSTYDWDASVADSSWPRPTVEQIIGNVIAGSRGGKRQRLIILMHDGGRDHSSTLAALPVIIEYLRQCGYTFATLS